MRILFIFLDGVGLGSDDPTNNPFAAADLPTLTSFTGGKRWLEGLSAIHSDRATFVPTDANLDVEGRPQSATGQAAIMTGLNVSQMIGRHYGPKPNDAIRTIIDDHGMIKRLTADGQKVRFLNAYPSGFFSGLNSGKRLLSSNQYALTTAGVALSDERDLLAGEAMSADFTGEGWRTVMGYQDSPVYSPAQAGAKLAELSRGYALTFFDQWVTDYVGHRGTIQEGIEQLEVLDGVVAGLLDVWNDGDGLIVITSDHGNLEDIQARGHTRNEVPTLVIGGQHREFCRGLTDLTGFAGRILKAVNNNTTS